MNRIARICVYLLIFSLLSSFISSYAAESDSEELLPPPQRYTYLAMISASVTTSPSGAAKCAALARISSGFNNYTVSISATLQRQTSSGWSNVKTWNKTGGSACYLEVYKGITSGYYYRLHSVVTVYSPSGVVVESQTVNSTVV